MENKEIKICKKCHRSIKPILIISKKKKKLCSECDCGIKDKKGRLIK